MGPNTRGHDRQNGKIGEGSKIHIIHNKMTVSNKSLVRTADSRRTVQALACLTQPKILRNTGVIYVIPYQTD
jgi:hypothetical protein